RPCLRLLGAGHTPARRPGRLFVFVARESDDGSAKNRAPGPGRRPAHPGSTASVHTAGMHGRQPKSCKRSALPAHLGSAACHLVVPSRNTVLPFIPILRAYPMTTDLQTNKPLPGRRQSLPVLRVGVGGPVGSGKTTLLEMLCKEMSKRYDLIAITNDIYTKEDQRLLTVSGALPAERIMGVETGGCPHT